MGQYQEWLRAQEVGKRLKGELETLEGQILYLKERITTLEQAVPETENVIAQALLAYWKNQSRHLETAEASESAAPSQAAPGMEAPRQLSAGPAPYLSGVYPPQRNVPRDMLAFFEEARNINPNFSFSRGNEGPENEAPPVDAETRRLNENIQRWFERWHREITGKAQTEVQNGQQDRR